MRSPARSLAERARGLAAISASSGATGRLVSRRKVGGRRLDLRQMARHADGAAALGEERLDDAVFERMEGHDHEPPAGLQDALGGRERRASSASSSLTKMRSAWNVRVAGWIWFGLARTTRADDVGQRPGGARSAPRLRAATMARATRARMALLAELEDDVGEIALGRLRHHVGGARAVAAHAHVERAVEPEREAALGLVELHRGHAEIEHDAVDRGVAEFLRDAIERGEALLDQRQPAAGRLDQTGAVRDRALVAVDADDLRIGGGEDRAAVAAGAEGAVDVDAAVANVQQLERRPREHGNVTGRSASDSRAIAARHHSRAPSGSSAALSKPGRFCSAHRHGGPHEARAEANRLPDCKGATGANAGKTGQRLHRPFPSIGYARRLGLFGSTSECLGERTGQASNGPHRGTEPPAGLKAV